MDFDFDVEKLIDEAMNVDGVDKKKVIKIMADSMRHKEDEKKTYEKLHKEIYKNILLPDECDVLIDSLYQGDERGARWTLEDTNSVASKLDIDFSEKPYTPEMFRAAMHIKYYDDAYPLKKSGVTLENTGWGRMADFFFCADDEKQDRLVDYFFDRM